MRLVAEENYYDHYDYVVELVPSGKDNRWALFQREAYNIPHPTEKHNNHRSGQWDEGDYLQREIIIKDTLSHGTFEEVSAGFLNLVSTLKNSGFTEVADNYGNYYIHSGQDVVYKAYYGIKS